MRPSPGEQHATVSDRGWRPSLPRVAGQMVLVVAAVLSLAGRAPAQQNVHRLYHAMMPPGAIGSMQLARGGPLVGYFQPVLIKGPAGVLAAMAEGGGFAEAETAPIRVGLLIGQVYRLRVMNIPLNPGAEVFPTIEIIDRLHPPAGQEERFPIVVEISHDDIMKALQGTYLTRVIYLEDPQLALPAAHAGLQPSFDLPPGQDPLAVADQIGRPVAILRMGGILPTADGQPDMQFLFGCPPWIRPALPSPPDPDQQVVPQGLVCGPLPAGTARPWPADEYICDGGDRNQTAKVTPDWEVRGLETEDTIAHYDTLDGRRVVEPSNRVCIYSPRFSAVRHVVGLRLNQQMHAAGGVRQETIMARVADTREVRSSTQNFQPMAEASRGLANLYQSEQGGGTLASRTRLRGFHQGSFMPYENLVAIRTGAYDSAETAWLASRANAAIAWSHDLGLQVIIDRQRAAAEIRDQGVSTVFTVNEPPTNPRLRLIKVASTPNALPGETVEFTLRFDNLGSQLIGNVTLIDNLTTRLEYVEHSAECSLDADFSTQPNEGQSLALRWEITEPMAPGDGGVIRFQCRVR
ncbi:MAG: DUF11 domain-containing protein [Pirellulaceae bacterium]|jgi:uncharacterized repeat protein (TIGR01451 family)|nr:hypothetical protein [Thermoguttaceae bacterium]MDI9443645.1 hypothetical protein [Planctomycetota bacterium]NLZ02897.1 DUF11 domain-containing protein [Pirellulaceae bacterium]